MLQSNLLANVRSVSKARPHAHRHPAAAACAALLVAIAPTALAQRVVRETTAQWRAAPALTLRLDKRWCDNADADGCDFKRIVTAIPLPDGGIVAAGATGPINRFLANGALGGTLGRRGQGPGEYGFVMGLNRLPNGMFAWFDNTQMRVATVAEDGKAGPVVRLMPPPTMSNLWLVGTELVVLDVPAAATRGDTVEATYHTVPASGAPRVLARVRTPSVFLPGSDMRPMAAPFATTVVADVGLSGDVAHSNGGRYLLDVFPSKGAPWRLEVDAPPRALTAADRDSATARLLRSFRAANVASLPSSIRAGLEKLPGNLPPLTSMRVLRDGTLWIRPVTAAGATLARWDVFSRDGQRLGRALLPLTAIVSDGERDWILITEPGPDDVSHVVRYHVGR